MKHLPKNPGVLYIASDVFAKGGIQRYSRTQISVLREYFGNPNVSVLSLWPPQENSFETPFEVTYHSRGLGFVQKFSFIIKVLLTAYKERISLIWINHIRLLPIAVLVKLISPKVNILMNIYGLEIWSGLRIRERIFLRYVSAIISDSNYSAKFFSKNQKFEREKIYVIWDPVDIFRFRPLEVNKKHVLMKYGVNYNENAFYLMILGRIEVGSRHKGYDRLIDLMGLIEEELIQLIICGDGNDRSRLKERVLEENLTDRVHFSGSIREDDLVKIYQASDVFVLVSDRGEWRGEGVPLTPLEAAACGKPIIVGDEDGSQEAVKEGINGFVVSPHDLEKLKKRVYFLYKNPDKKKEMGYQARLTIIEDFSNQVFKDRTVSVIEYFLAKG